MKTLSLTAQTEAGKAIRSKASGLKDIVECAVSVRLRRRVVSILRLIEPDCYLEESKGLLQASIESGALYWDMCCALAAYAELCQPTSYLEIGVRRGRSASLVGAIQPDVSLYLFDMWHPEYAGVPNPGPDFVRGQLRRVGHRGEVHFVDGRSQETIPEFFRSSACPDSFELMTVDGDHRDAGARADLDNVVPRLACGGLLLFDDITHPTYPTLHEVWQSFMAQHEELIAVENLHDATGTALAIRAK